VVQICPGLNVCKQVTVCPGHIWTTLYIYNFLRCFKTVMYLFPYLSRNPWQRSVQSYGSTEPFQKHWCTRWFKHDRDYLCVNKSQFVPVIFEPPCRTTHECTTDSADVQKMGRPASKASGTHNNVLSSLCIWLSFNLHTHVHAYHHVTAVYCLSLYNILFQFLAA
jgi:hypothetical protein